ncbi:hypothetical protein J6590_097353, partial [Homalodisca vitripennis]
KFWQQLIYVKLLLKMIVVNEKHAPCILTEEQLCELQINPKVPVDSTVENLTHKELVMKV